MWSRHSPRTVRTHRSATAFARGARNCVSITRTPSEPTIESNGPQNFASRSWIRKRTFSSRSSIARLRACCVTQAQSGFAVTPARWTRREPCSIQNSTYSVRSQTVSTVKKSQASTPCAWRARTPPRTGRCAAGPDPAHAVGGACDFRAAYVEPPEKGLKLPAVRLTLPDGTVVTSEEPNLAQMLSTTLRREVAFAKAQHDGESPAAQAEAYWPDMEGLEHRDMVTEWELPAGTFFDLAVVHLLTTATIEHLRALYPEGRFEVRRFRPNIVVATGPAQEGFVENDWIDRTLAIGDEVRLRITGPCPRCVMTTLPQGDLPKDAGILRTAAQNNQANVGVYAAVVTGGTVRRGDDVMVA